MRRLCWRRSTWLVVSLADRGASIFSTMSRATDTAKGLLQSHRTLAVFLAKMLVAYAIWFVVYDLWLLPDGRLDEWLSVNVATWTAALMGLFTAQAFADGRYVAYQNAAIIIEDGCNGLAALSLFVVFVLAYPGTGLRRALFIPAGLAIIVVTNVARCASLLVISARWPSIFEDVHGFHALFVFYVVIFVLWVVWTHIGERQESVPQPA